MTSDSDGSAENNMAEAMMESKEASLTRVSAKSSSRRRFVGTKSHAGQKTDKLTGNAFFFISIPEKPFRAYSHDSHVIN